MLSIIIIIHFAVLMVLTGAFIFIARQKPSRVQNAAMTLVGSLLVLMLAFFSELASQRVEVMEMMHRIQFVSVCAISLSTLWFAAAFCNFKVPKGLYFFEYFFTILMATCVLSQDHHNIVYKDFTMYFNGNYMSAQFTPQIGYILLNVNLVLILIYAIFCTLRQLKYSRGVERKRIFWVTVGLAIPGLLTGLKLLVPQSHFDTVTISLLGEISCFLVAFVRFGYFDSIQAASSNFADFGAEGLIILSAGGQIRDMNAVAKKLFPQYKISQIIKDDDTIKGLLDHSQSTVQVDKRTFGVKVEPIIERGYHQGDILWLVDMTDHYNSLGEMERLTRWATSASQVKSNFLTSMSHEIRTPMNAVLGLDRMILRESKEPKIIDYAENIERAGNSLLGIINDILDISQIENGELEINSGEYYLSSLVTDMFNLTMWRAQDKNLELRLNVAMDIPDRLLGDEVRIRQAMTNLVGNAIKYTNEGYVEISISWKWSEARPDTIDMRFAVTDTGIGISQEDQKKLFEDFVRLDEVKNRSIEGTGLGLSITRQLVNLMEGDVELESELGRGSCFAFTIPQGVLDSAPIGNLSERLTKPERRADAPSFFAPETTVLLVDDNDMNLMVYSELLRRTGMRVTTAASGAECIRLMGSNRYSIVLLDHMMPELDGAETLKRLRQMNLLHGTPVIALTANAVVGAKEMYLEMGFDDYVPKSVEPKYLEEVIARHLKPSEKTVPAQEQPTVLLLDENAERLTAMRGILKDKYKLAPVRTVEQALAFTKKHRPKAILSAAASVQELRDKLEVDTKLICVSCEQVPDDGFSLHWPFTAQDAKKVIGE